MLRVNNECVPLEEEVLTLPAGRHSAVCVSNPAEGVPELIIRLRTRKHRPQGSILRRACACRDYKITKETNTCVVHRMEPLLGQMEVGQQIFASVSAAAHLATLRSLLALLEVPNASKYTWKCFRAGKASALAAAGSSLQLVLQSGR